MADTTNSDGWDDDVPEFDPEEAQRQREQDDRQIEAEIEKRQKP